jgi:hypothetical protein
MKNLFSLLSLCLALGVAISFSSCKKKKDPEPTYSVVGTWKTGKVYMESNKSETLPNFDNFEITFKEDKSYEVKEGDNSVTTLPTQGTYEKSSETAITFKAEGKDPVNGIIQKLDDNSFRFYVPGKKDDKVISDNVVYDLVKK